MNEIGPMASSSFTSDVVVIAHLFLQFYNKVLVRLKGNATQFKI